MNSKGKDSLGKQENLKERELAYKWIEVQRENRREEKYFPAITPNLYSQTYHKLFAHSPLTTAFASPHQTHPKPYPHQQSPSSVLRTYRRGNT
jgi:hypothetical protein